MSSRKRYPKNSIGTKAALIRCAVQINQDMIQSALVIGIPAKNSISNFSIHIIDSAENTFSIITVLITITKFRCFKHTCRCAGRNSRPCESSIFQCHFYFYRGISTGIKNLSCVKICNNCHDISLFTCFFINRQ